MKTYLKKNQKTTKDSIKFKGKIQDNYDSYLKENLMIGFINSFKDEVEVYKTKKIQANCRGYFVEFNVRYCKVSFGDGKYFCHAIKTDRVDIRKHLGAFSFGSMAHLSESKVMEEAVVELAKELNLMICNKVNSWPFAVAIVQENFYVE